MDSKEFLKQLGEKLKAEGLPLLEQDLLKLLSVMIDHAKSYQFENPVIGAVAMAALAAGEPLLRQQIDKIDKSEDRA